MTTDGDVTKTIIALEGSERIVAKPDTILSISLNVRIGGDSSRASHIDGIDSSYPDLAFVSDGAHTVIGPVQRQRADRADGVL